MDGNPPPRIEIPVEPIDGKVYPNVHPPPERLGRRTNQLKFLSKVIKAVMKHKFAWPFHTPVDTIVLNIPDYHTIIKQSMDLETIKQRLENNYYWCARECIDDFNTMLGNCYTYNRPNEDVVIMAKDIENLFRSQVAKMPKSEYDISISSNRRASINSRKPENITSKTMYPEKSSDLPFDQTERSLKRKSVTESLEEFKFKIPKVTPPQLDSKISKPLNSNIPIVAQHEDVSEGLKLCQNILCELLSEKNESYAWPFYTPVDAEALELENYYQIIKRPMDLRNIEEKLENNKYKTPQEFESDIKLIFSNCYLYFPPSHDIFEMAKKLEKIFEELKKITMSTNASSGSSNNTARLISNIHNVTSSSDTSSSSVSDARNSNLSKSDTDSCDSETDDEAQVKIKKLEEHMLLLQHDVENLKAIKSKPKKKVKPTKNALVDVISDNAKYTSYTEKIEIAKRIHLLPENKLNDIVNIIKVREPSIYYANPDEIHIDFQKISQRSLDELKDYLAS